MPEGNVIDVRPALGNRSMELPLADLTTEAQPSRSLRRVLRAPFRALRLLTPASAKLVPLLPGEPCP